MENEIKSCHEPEFPLEIIVLIGSVDVSAWRALLAIPDFARWTQSKQARAIVDARFVKKRVFFNMIERKIGNKLHCFNKPAVIYRAGGHELWYQNNLLHRDDGPASICPASGLAPFEEIWYNRGQIHRTDGPAMITIKLQKWYQNGLLHRDNDLPAVITTSGTQKWYQNGQLHRENNAGNDRPAVIKHCHFEYYYLFGVRYK